VQHAVDRAIDVDVLRDVVPNELKILIAKVSDVGEVAGDADYRHRPRCDRGSAALQTGVSQ
jgi:hypothetical protein